MTTRVTSVSRSSGVEITRCKLQPTMNAMPTAPTSARVMIFPNWIVRSLTSERSDSTTTMPITSFLSVMGRATSRLLPRERLPRLMPVQDVRATRGRRRRGLSRPGCTAAKSRAVGPEDGGRHDVFVDRDGAERFAGAAGVAERERCGAVLADDIGQQAGVAAEPLTRGRDVVRHDEHAGDDHRRGTGRRHRSPSAFAPARDSGTTA